MRTLLLFSSLALLNASAGDLFAESLDFLGDPTSAISMTHRQQWGEFGRNTAAARPGTVGSPLRIGERTFKRGLGHHANGEVTVDLEGRYNAFRALVGVQWQGGNRGSVVFRIFVDGNVVFECGPMSDSDPARQVHIPLEKARELRLNASDGGDGIACDMANWAEACLVSNSRLPRSGSATVLLNGVEAPPRSAAVAGFSLIATPSGPQVSIMEPARQVTIGVRRNDVVQIRLPVFNCVESVRLSAEVALIHGSTADVELSLGDQRIKRTLRTGDPTVLETEPSSGGEKTIVMTTRGMDGESGVRWRRLRFKLSDRSLDISLVTPAVAEQYPPPILPPLHRAIEQELIEWDWRMQDGIGTGREPRSWKDAIEITLSRGDDLIHDLVAAGVALDDLGTAWAQSRAEWKTLSTAIATPESRHQDLWRQVHRLRRQIAFRNPLAAVDPLLFIKRVPSCFSHQLTQYYGSCARPGGGLFILEEPGSSMRCRRLADLPEGSYEHLDVSWDGRRALFAFCEASSAPRNRETNLDRYYHLYEIDASGKNLRQLTSGPHDDFSPRYLQDGSILFLSTRRGGFHRCGRGPCPVYTLAIANADGKDIRVISYHETHEWDPAVLNDGRIIYTRWDYVDRHAVHYQQLWTVRPDGSDVRIFYGNNTFNPVGIWEARPVPNSHLVMATAGAHHAMTAGSIILLDVTRGIDGLEPISRLTPDALFPESEFPVAQWHATAGVPEQPAVPVEEKRWPGHCYRTPHPLSETYFLASYSFDPLIGEPHANRANMFGLYLVDRFGNKELIYRDLNIGSLWPTPLQRRRPPPLIASALEEIHPGEGTFFLQNVYESWPELPARERNRITRLRLVQVLPKTTPHANSPRVGLANASPGKQVLGTVPVEADGSAYFRAPAEVPLAFQALDERGMAVQTMRSLTYLQPGEHATCIGCHEDRARVPDPRATAMARNRPPSVITAGPEGSKPFSYPVLVQPVLDRHCIGCHGDTDAAAEIVLTGTPSGSFTASYNALAPLVPYSEWKSTPGANAEPLTRPDQFGARASKLMSLLLEGHEDVTLNEDELERLVTWMDANALFYGTFDPEDQKRQQRGERIAGPALE